MAKVARETTDVHLVPDAPQDTEQFGLRVNWQSEDERLEAAEFMIATRMQEDARRRVAAAALAVRTHNREELTAAVHHKPTQEDESLETGEQPAD